MFKWFDRFRKPRLPERMDFEVASLPRGETIGDLHVKIGQTLVVHAGDGRSMAFSLMKFEAGVGEGPMLRLIASRPYRPGEVVKTIHVGPVPRV